MTVSKDGKEVNETVEPGFARLIPGIILWAVFGYFFLKALGVIS